MLCFANRDFARTVRKQSVVEIKHMFHTITNRLLQRVPSEFRRRLAFKLLRSASPEFRAFTELFVAPYDAWFDWRSGLGDSVHVLYGLVRGLRPDVIVEIGSARGKSTCALALACRQNGKGKVYAIDPHDVNAWTELHTNGETLPFLRERLASYELGSWCEILRADSQSAARSWTQSIDLLFIDGDHSFEGVRHDFEAFSPWLHQASLVVFHDTTWEHHKDHIGYREDMGVPRYMHELKRAGYPSVTIASWPGLTVLCPNANGFPFLTSPSSDASLTQCMR